MNNHIYLDMYIQLYIVVGGFNPSEKYESVGVIIPNRWKNKTCSKPPTIIYIYMFRKMGVVLVIIHFCLGCPITNYPASSSYVGYAHLWKPPFRYGTIFLAIFCGDIHLHRPQK